MAQTKVAESYAKLAGQEEWHGEHCKCVSRHFRVAVIHENRNARVRITCVRCGWQFLGLWAADWQVEDYAWDKHPPAVDETACIFCGTLGFAVKTQNESNILRVRVGCNKCDRLLLKFGAAQYQLS